MNFGGKFEFPVSVTSLSVVHAHAITSGDVTIPIDPPQILTGYVQRFILTQFMFEIFQYWPRFVRLDGVMSSILCVWLIVVYYFKHFIVKLNLFVNENSTDIIYCTKGDIKYLKKIQIIYVALLECAMFIFECANVSFPFVVNKHLCKEKRKSFSVLFLNYTFLLLAYHTTQSITMLLESIVSAPHFKE